MILSDLLHETDILEIRGRRDINITGIAYDSRKCEPGYIFTALKGSSFDGHQFIQLAIDKGAAAILCEEIPDNIVDDSITFVKVSSTRKTLAQISHKWFNYPCRRLKVIGVTGTNGKTTTTYLLKSIFEKAGHKCGLIGTTGILIEDEYIPATHTTPESLELAGLLAKMAERNVSVVLMEVSSHSLHQDRVEGIDFEMALFTNLTPDHLDYHSDMYEYATAKKKLFDLLNPDAKAIIFDNSEFSEYIAKDTKAKIFYIGRKDKNDFRIESENLSLGKAIFILSCRFNDTFRDIVIEISLSGSFNIDNAALAAAATLAYGIEETVLRNALMYAAGAPGRMQPINLNNGALALVDYAHTPDALQKALTACREVLTNASKSGKLICVFGCGGDRDRTKRPIMGSISANIADYTIITNDNPRNEDPDKIIEEICDGISEDFKHKVVEIKDRAEAINYAVNFVQENDILLVAGKGHENYQVIGTEKLHFDDAELIRELNK